MVVAANPKRALRSTPRTSAEGAVSESVRIQSSCSGDRSRRRPESVPDAYEAHKGLQAVGLPECPKAHPKPAASIAEHDLTSTVA